MNEVERWMYFDGPEPENLRPLLDALRDSPPPTPADEERMTRRLFEKLDAALAARAERRRAEPGPGGVAVGVPPATVPPATVAPATVMAPTEIAPTEIAPPARAGRLVEDVPEAFDGAPARGEPSPPPAPVVPMPPVVRANEALKSTRELDLSAMVPDPHGPLPFRPRDPAAPRAARTLQGAVAPASVGGTLPLGSDAITKAIALLPFPGSAAGTAPVKVPNLTLDEYASLCAELEVSPELVDALRVKYTVPNAAAHRALDEHWGERLAARPDEGAAFRAKVTEFAAFLRRYFRK